MRSAVLATLATAAAASTPRYVLYFDQYHTTTLPNTTVTAGINYVITAFANSSLFTTEPAGNYTPFMTVDAVRAMFDNDTKVCMAIGGWGDTAGFSVGANSSESRALYATNVAATLDTLGYDCVDVDWEYPGGDGADYRQIPNSEKVGEIDTYPLLLQEIKSAIGDKELSIAVPGLARDMIAFTAEKVPLINDAVDFVNVMTYDLMSRRDNFTNHHTSINGSLETIDTYLSLGMTASKMNLGFAFYAKWFTTKSGYNCTTPTGCPTELLEAADGSDTGLSGALTFEAANFAATPTNLTTSPDTSCGAGTLYQCPTGQCCSQYGWCGNTTAHCGTGCQSDYGTCDGVSTTDSFKKALTAGQTDKELGGQWYWDSAADIFWTWETPELMAQKFTEIVQAKGLGGVMAWSLAEDSYDWSHLLAMQKGVYSLSS